MRPFVHRAVPAGSLLALVFAMHLLQGCPAKPPPPALRFPIASGFHSDLPAPQQRILIWGDPPLLDVAGEWLRSHQYSNLLAPESDPLRSPRVMRGFVGRRAAMAVAHEMKAEFVVFLDREESKEGALIESHCGSLFHVSVTVRGLSMERADIAFQGSAHYPQCVALDGETFRNLTCQAFATAWGFRPSGQLDIPSSLMCTTGQTETIPIR